MNTVGTPGPTRTPDASEPILRIGRMPALVVGVVLAALSCAPPQGESPVMSRAPVRVVLSTGSGPLEVEVDPRRAPITSANFLRYVDAGHYDGGRFHRTVHLDNQPDDEVRIEVIQGGVDPERAGDDFPPIPLERTSVTGLSHIDGAISMARLGPDTATSDFFICIGDQPELDFGGRRNPDGQGFAVFGRVVRGMEHARAIQRAPADGQALRPPILIRRAFRAEPDS